MGISCLILGLFFLLNPNVILIDVLPDFIGYILILTALAKASRVSLTLRDAFVSFRYLLFANLIKHAALILYLSFAGGEGDVWGLLFTFSFGIFEAIFGVRAFKSLFDGMIGLADLGHDSADYESQPVFNRLKEVRLLSYLFAVAKPLLAALPEFVNLSDLKYGTVTVDGIQSLARYRLLFTVIAALIALILGLVWFIRMAIYFGKIGKDRAFLDEINRRYQQLAESNPIRFVTSRIFIGLNLLFVAALFSLEFKLDGFNLLPHPIFLSIILASLFWLKKIYPAPCKRGIPATIVAIIGSAAAWVYTFLFIYSFYSLFLTDSAEGAAFSVSSVLETKLPRDFSVLYGFWGMIFAAVADGLLFIPVLLSLRSLLLSIIRDHTGGTIAPDGHLIGGSAKTQTRPARRLLNAVVLSGILSAASGVAHAALLPYFPAYWMIDSLIRLGFILLLILLISKIRADMKDRYDLA